MSMEKPIVLLTAPVATRSGYGNHARDIARALIEIDEYDFKINSVPWGNTPRTALEDGNEHHEKIKSHILKSSVTNLLLIICANLSVPANAVNSDSVSLLNRLNIIHLQAFYHIVRLYRKVQQVTYHHIRHRE